MALVALCSAASPLSMGIARRSRDLLERRRHPYNTRVDTEAGYCFGTIYANTTRLDGKTVFSGSRYFRIEEIGIVEITD
jgi:hypothetical protein